MSIQLEREHFVDPYRYNIFLDPSDNDFKARNALTKAIDFKGTNFRTVMLAILSAIKSSGGGKIHIDKSVIASYTGTILIDSSNVEIEAEVGHQLTISGIMVGIQVAGSLGSYVSNVKLKGLNFIGDPTNDENHGVDFHYVKDSSVEDCRMKDIGDEAIDFYDCIRCRAVRNYLENCGVMSGSALECNEQSDNGSFDNYLGQNIVIDSKFNAIHAWQIHNAKIEGNVVINANWGKETEDYWTGGIYVFTTVRGTKEVEVVGNTVRGCKFSGIKVRTTGSPAQKMYDVKIIGNKVFDCTTNGIHVAGGEDNIRPVVEHNYVARNGSAGIYFNAFCGSIHGNICVDNPVSGTSFDNIYLSSADNNNIEGNTCVYTTAGVGRYQIFLNALCNRNNVTNNKIYRPASEQTAIYIGITSDDNHVSDNYIDGAWTAIAVGASTCDKNEIVDNKCINVTNCVDSGTDTIIERNYKYNPVGIITNPYPATTGDLKNTSGVQAYPTSTAVYTVKQTPKTVIVGGGTITTIYIDGVDTGLTAGVFRLARNQTIRVDWTVQPTINQVRAE